MSLLHVKLAVSLSCCLLLTTWATAAWLQQPPEVTAKEQTDNNSTETGPQMRMREGTKVKEISGAFRLTVDRVEFHPSDESTPLTVLENLALERVVSELSNDLVLVWQVDGTVTEYHGRNYLLVDRAFVRSTIEK